MLVSRDARGHWAPTGRQQALRAAARDTLRPGAVRRAPANRLQRRPAPARTAYGGWRSPGRSHRSGPGPSSAYLSVQHQDRPLVDCGQSVGFAEDSKFRLGGPD